MAAVTVAAPAGSHFESEEVRTQRGEKSLGEQPILVWDDLAAARTHYGDEGIINSLDGTSLRVSFQSIARRFAMAGKTADDIAKAQVEFKPGKRQGGVSTPVSRARNMAAKAADKLGEKGDLVATFLARVAAGEISDEDLAALSK